MSRLALRPNVGAEEPGGSQIEAAQRVGRAWRLLFPRAAQWPDSEPLPTSEAISRPEEPAFAWLPTSGLCAWWNDRASAEVAEREGLALAGPSPEVVARVHDKAFAAKLCREERNGPRWLRECVRCYDPAELADGEAFRETLRRELASWPEALARSATLKPRLGTSGRGRVRADDPDAPSLVGALPRLAARGGAVLEPWLERSADHSVQLHVARDGTLTLLGVLTLCVSASGVHRGHRGELDHRGRVLSGADGDDALLGAASDAARAAHAAGYHGPCGIDAFTFRWEGEDALRPLVEFNARFTTGTVLIGLLHRVRPWLDARLPPVPGERRSFAFSFGDEDALALPGASQRLSLAGGQANLTFAPGPLRDRCVTPAQVAGSSRRGSAGHE